ncbi:MAG TPA: single-stranded-DNA-specific exonuclease RecJ [Deltaproteobacteria bacterium]|nr:single-stranded-DNA-specific exonuclease RecJ [Deltaproteobacteria bacterium]
MSNKYHALNPDNLIVDQIRKSLNCSRIMATVLANRGITDAEHANRFLNPSLSHLAPPFSIKDMEKAVFRIITAIENNEKILVFGDYDVDGVTSTVLLYEFLQSLGASVSYYIPHRAKEGYSLQKQHIHNLAEPKGYRLIITTDCGSSSHEAIEAAREKSIDVIVTDHHHVPDILPPALALLNPKRKDCHSGFEHLAGVGVAFSLLICLRKELRSRNYWKTSPEPNLKECSDLVALGTVADQVPLIKDNRILVKTGIRHINRKRRPGLIALSSVAEISDRIDAENIAFRLAPRLNAPGRLDHPHLAVKLLLSKNQNEAEHIAQSLNRLNSDRKNIEQEIFLDIRNYLEKDHLASNQNSIVLANSTWHEGVIGIVAARIAELYHCPVALIAEKGGIGKGSARSVSGFDLFEGLKTCRNHLETFGGHSMAAGFRVNIDEIPQFKDAFERAVTDLGMADESEIGDCIPIDCSIDFNDITEQLIDSLEALEPFGNGNPEPVFQAKTLSIVSQKIVGSRHRQLVLAQPSVAGKKYLHAIQFNVDSTEPLDDSLSTPVFRLRWNRWNGRKRPQLIIL